MGRGGVVPGLEYLASLVGEQSDPEGDWHATCSSGTISPSQVLPSNILLSLQCGGWELSGSGQGRKVQVGWVPASKA